ncbi:hypothetical protein [Arthrobacter oryzae]|uniref:hypothetical protein n=1 Tax=Arthrobacter oryzae TaxID=409290 RepID=UPI00273AEA76|nr:hypothetical protein [Arthrobacter oryzae]WLQ05056.1 hypothetical protein Q8Z05_12955 [Arthrobacter oryzae]
MVNNPLRSAFNSAPSGNWLDRLAKASLLAAEREYYGRPESSLLKVTAINKSTVDAYESATLLRSLQAAAGKIGHVLRDGGTEVTSVLKVDRQRAPLICRGQVGSTVYFSFPEPDAPEQDEMPGLGPHRTLAEAAIHELLEILPSTSDDDRSLDAVLGQRMTLRSAISHLVEAVQSNESGLGLTFTAAGSRSYSSVLTSEQADVLSDALMASHEDIRIIEQEGVLDGMRSSRRVFYLQPDSGVDIYGAVDASLLPQVQQHLGQRIHARLEASTIQQRSGKKSTTTYRLLALTPVQTLFDEDHQ